jgi:hypothetical protein
MGSNEPLYMSKVWRCLLSVPGTAPAKQRYLREQSPIGGTASMKAVIRRLPPYLTKDEFASAFLAPSEGKYDWFSYLPGSLATYVPLLLLILERSANPLHCSAYSPAVCATGFINFKTEEKLREFHAMYQNYQFIGPQHETYSTLVEKAPNQRVPGGHRRRHNFGPVEKDSAFKAFMEAASAASAAKSKTALEMAAHPETDHAKEQRDAAIVLSPLILELRKAEAKKANKKQHKNASVKGAADPSGSRDRGGNGNRKNRRDGRKDSRNDRGGKADNKGSTHIITGDKEKNRGDSKGKGRFGKDAKSGGPARKDKAADWRLLKRVQVTLPTDGDRDAIPEFVPSSAHSLSHPTPMGGSHSAAPRQNKPSKSERKRKEKEKEKGKEKEKDKEREKGKHKDKAREGGSKKSQHQQSLSEGNSNRKQKSSQNSQRNRSRQQGNPSLNPSDLDGVPEFVPSSMLG